MKHLFSPAGYKVIGYPLTPAVFIIGNMWIIYFSVKTRPMTALAGLRTIVFGIMVYVYFSKFKRRVS
jgi:basic amino acid/polyamine antiporter, APA family